MMRNRLVLLPTYEIVKETSMYDPYLDFLPKGVRSVILEAVFSKSFNYRDVYQEFPSKIPFKSGLVGLILSQYDDYIVQRDEEELVLLPNNRLSRTRPQNHLETMQAVELIVGEIEQRVTEMLRSVLATEYFDIAERSTRWQGLDLIADLLEFSEREVTTNYRDAAPTLFRRHY